jgi:PAS domain S-box-containing protein
MKAKKTMKVSLVNKTIKQRQRIVDMKMPAAGRKLIKRVEKVGIIEQNLIKSLEPAPDACVYCDKEGNIIGCNRMMEKITGYEKNELIGKSFMDLEFIPAVQAPRMRVSFDKITLEHSAGPNEYTIRRRDGEKAVVQVDAHPLMVRSKLRVLGIVRDITKQKEIEAQLLTYQNDLQSMASRLSLAEEGERRRIAMEVHDRIGQTLAMCRMKLEALTESEPSPDWVERVAEVQTCIKQLIEKTRSLAFELSSPLLYEIGLEAAIEQLAEQVQQHGVLLSFEGDGETEPLTEDVRVLIYQAVRELITNIIKHAHAQHAKVSIKRYDDTLCIIVEDDGVGFNVAGNHSDKRKAKGFGLFSVRERLRYIGGYLKIESDHGSGTRITLIVPLNKNARQD